MNDIHKVVNEIKNEMDYQLNNIDTIKIKNLIEIIKNRKGNIYCSGVGKSGTVASHFSDLLKSISINIYYLNPCNALHGDIGNINKNDIVIMFSKSGNTKEMINLVPFLRRRKVYLIGICCDKNSKFSNICDLVMETPFQNEIKGTINKIPTNSIISQITFCNIVVSVLKKDIKISEYKNNHPAGNIGNQLKTIKEAMSLKFPYVIFKENEEIELTKILLEMTKYNCGCCLFLNPEKNLLGLMLDGDIRRKLLRYPNLKKVNIDDININCKKETDPNKLISEYDKHYKYIPFIKNNKVIGLCHIY
jgi:arabinose-5-phosphate isomerase